MVYSVLLSVLTYNLQYPSCIGPTFYAIVYFDLSADCMITVNDLIKEVSKKYPESDSILHLIIDGYQKKEIFEQVDLGKGKTQAYSYIEKIQKYAKELYNKKYR